MKWIFELKGLEFAIEGDLDPAKFAGKTASGRAGYQEIRVNIIPNADVSEETLEEWLESVEARCPVSDNLANETPVKLSVNVE